MVMNRCMFGQVRDKVKGSWPYHKARVSGDDRIHETTRTVGSGEAVRARALVAMPGCAQQVVWRPQGRQAPSRLDEHAIRGRAHLRRRSGRL